MGRWRAGLGANPGGWGLRLGHADTNGRSGDSGTARTAGKEPESAQQTGEERAFEPPRSPPDRQNLPPPRHRLVAARVGRECGKSACPGRGRRVPSRPSLPLSPARPAPGRRPRGAESWTPRLLCVRRGDTDGGMRACQIRLRGCEVRNEQNSGRRHGAQTGQERACPAAVAEGVGPLSSHAVRPPRRTLPPAAAHTQCTQRCDARSGRIRELRPRQDPGRP